MIRASLAIFLAAALAFPRQPARQGQPAAAAPEAVIKVQTRIVQVNVIVEDRKGRPVEGLTKEVDWPLVCSAALFDSLDDRAGFVKLGAKAIKGHQPVDVYGWRPDDVAVSG